jgi:amino acid adenylation domain-containing protein
MSNSDSTLIGLLEQTAQRHPQRTAFRFGSEALTYAELRVRAYALARELLHRGVGRGDRIAVVMHKGIEMPVAVYGAMAAGAVYVPIDPLAPSSRIERILEQCGVRLSIASERLAAKLSGFSSTDVLIAGAQTFEYEPSGELPPLPALSGEDLAYVIFTSGSTGVPKGIVHTHASASAFATMMVEHFGVDSTDVVSGVSPLHFDMSTFDFFAANSAGACTVLLSEAHQKAPASLTALVERDKLTVWYSTPFSLIQALDFGGLEARDWSSLRSVIYAGEPFPVRQLNRLMERLPQARFSNAYGPAETNVSHIFDLPRGPWPSTQVPIGRPCRDVLTRIVDDEGHDAIEGELWISAPTMLKEYWRAPEISAKALASHEGRRYYRTGDTVRQIAPDGTCEFLGRNDRQIKLRGFRIELDEVEQALTRIEGVAQAGAVLIGSGAGERAIVADVLLKPGYDMSGEEIRKRTFDELPRYAVPREIKVRTELPLTSSGKLDRRAIRRAWGDDVGDDA